ncbi:MAG: DUF2269 domain-containing protein [Usitatibacteraceae bacterium]
MDAYTLWKTAHVLSATILVGTGIGIAFFCWFGSRDAIKRNDIGALRTVLRFTVVADAIFTAPAVVLQLLSGGALLQLAGWSWTSAWSISVLALFVLVGACWLPVVWIQVRLRRLADSAATIAQLPPEFAAKFRVWFLLGIPAFTAIVAIVYLMVAKPLAVV